MNVVPLHGSGIHRFRNGRTFALLALSGLCLASCTIAKEVSKVAHTVEGNKSTIDAFTNKVKSGESASFEATYLTTGTSPATIVYAVRQPGELLFKDTPSGSVSNSNTFDIIVNASGEYVCSPPSGAKPTTCEKLSAASASTENSILDFYTPSHWVTFLNDFSIAAGFAGDKVSSSSMSVGGFNMRCVDLVAPGVPGTSTICTTAQGILGYVKVAADSTSFEIKSYSSTPAASLFELPPGAKVTVPVTTTT
jgi:hypothetical protein